MILNLSNIVSTFKPVDDGWYPAIISKVVDAISKSGKEMLEVTFRIPSGRLVWERFVVSSDPASVSMQILKRLVAATGLDADSPDFDTEMLQDEALYIRVGHRDDPEYGTQNRITGYRAFNDADETDESDDE